jgi:hypothetical protein
VYVIDQTGRRYFVADYRIENDAVTIWGIRQRIRLTFTSATQAQTLMQVLDQYASGTRGVLQLPVTATQEIAWE